MGVDETPREIYWWSLPISDDRKAVAGGTILKSLFAWFAVLVALVIIISVVGSFL